ncbi:MAG: PKD domain-containing protein, partial [Bacteroidetes bacterium]|nr:PKD domain-containing protein [Bacteroidota bacterium]
MKIYSRIKQHIVVHTHSVRLWSVMCLLTLILFPFNEAYSCGGTPSFSLPSSGCVGSKISFTFSTTGASVNSYVLDFGDGTDSTKNSSGTIDHVYSSSGKFYVMLIRKLTGCTDTLLDSITIYNKPSATFSLKTDSICSDQVDSFFASTSGLASYKWKLSTGDSFATKDVAVALNNSGTSPITVNVKLITTNSNGCKDSTNKNVVVMPLPVASFTFTGDSSCSGSTINYNNASAGS